MVDTCSNSSEKKMGRRGRRRRKEGRKKKGQCYVRETGRGKRMRRGSMGKKERDVGFLRDQSPKGTDSPWKQRPVT